MLSLARALERGTLDAPGRPIEVVLRGLAAMWCHFAENAIVRPLRVPAGIRVVTVGGSTLGGSGKTPVAIACAAKLATAGARVAFVGHAYRAMPRRARVVDSYDSLRDVGDEALLAARALGPLGVPVVVAPRRELAVDLAARFADVLVLDGVAQIAPVRAELALLAVDASEPWGRGSRVPPRGDLRAPIAALLAACDMVVSVGGVSVVAEGAEARTMSRGAWLGKTLHTWESLAGLRVGLLSALARPERIVRALALRGISLQALVHGRDHGPLTANARAAASRAKVDLWLATPKCLLHLSCPLSVPVARIDHAVELSDLLNVRLMRLLRTSQAVSLQPRAVP